MVFLVGRVGFCIDLKCKTISINTLSINWKEQDIKLDLPLL